MTKRMSRWPCIFSGKFVREQVDPRVKAVWESTTGQKAPFGRLRMNFQQEHCRTINPYGSDSCPYREEECAMAFLSAVQNTLLPWVDDPAAYFVKLARANGAERADNKPLAREMHREEGPGNPGGRQRGARPRPPRNGETVRGLTEEDLVRRAANRPQSIGALLGTLHVGPHQDGTSHGKESIK